jgi:hypothetical protein
MTPREHWFLIIGNAGLMPLISHFVNMPWH